MEMFACLDTLAGLQRHFLRMTNEKLLVFLFGTFRKGQVGTIKSQRGLDYGDKQFSKERIFKMTNSATDNKNFVPPSTGFRTFSRLIKEAAPTFVFGGILTLLMGTEILAQVDGVDKIIQEVSTSIIPNLKFGTGVVAGTLGLGIAIAGLLKTSPRMLLSGAGLAIVPATLWDSVVGTAATILIP